MTTSTVRRSPARQALGLALAALRGDRSRRSWLADWLKLPPPHYSVTVKRKQPTTMRDGRVLFADHYIPKTHELCPTILIRSPWGRGWDKPPFSLLYMFVAQRFAEQGYRVVVQSTDMLSFQSNLSPAAETPDSEDTLAWLVTQPWFNGNVGMWGASILGHIQWSIAAVAPPALKAIVPSITSANWRDLYYEGSIFRLADLLMLLNMLYGIQPRRWRKSAPKAEAIQKKGLQAAYLKLPVREADLVAFGRALPGPYRAILDHPQVDDPFWDKIDHRPTLKQVTIPTHLVGGWHDIFLRSLLTDYVKLREGGQRPYLTIGPWNHIAPDAGWESVRQALTWFDAHLKSEPQQLRSLPIRLYVMGADIWREFPDWPPAERLTACSYYLHADQQLLQEAPNADGEAPDQYHYDPTDPTPSIGGPLLNPDLGGQRDQQKLEIRSDVLCYTTLVLKQPATLIGSAKLNLYAHSTAPSVDFVGHVCDVQPDGRSLNVCSGIVRIETGETQDIIRRIEIELWPIAYTFLAGHRIRLTVASAAHPRWNRNLGTGEPWMDATKTVVATQSLYHDRAHPSELVLPVEHISSL